ncbi:hypothetical protein GGI64_005524 [Rhizobium leguminosarum]|uniref:Uncharacterized protein n=1 Tax=Rhizobium leguminosarum TaxID=384 RepID=A0A7W9ZXM0_RHILE|nr:hypothetical protein [Rhizobium sp. BK619]MBB6223509.1 hypothetical protein [Rhizobium leguminosarum]NYJ14431.1 hypothetical protein [Rhizobium leguminosarum]
MDFTIALSENYRLRRRNAHSHHGVDSSMRSRQYAMLFSTAPMVRGYARARR